MAHPALEPFVAAPAWQEARHELTKRVAIMAERASLSEAVAKVLLDAAVAVAELPLTLVGSKT